MATSEIADDPNQLLVGTRNASIKSYRLTGGSLRMDNNPASWHLLGGHWQSSRFPPTPSRLVRDTLLPCPYAQLHVDRLRCLSMSIYVNRFSSFHLPSPGRPTPPSSTGAEFHLYAAPC